VCEELEDGPRGGAKALGVVLAQVLGDLKEGGREGGREGREGREG